MAGKREIGWNGCKEVSRDQGCWKAWKIQSGYHRPSLVIALSAPREQNTSSRCAVRKSRSSTHRQTLNFHCHRLVHISTSRPTSPGFPFFQHDMYKIYVNVYILTTPQVLLKILKHSTDPLPAAPTTHVQQDRNPPPQTALSARPDAVGVLLGLDLDGVLEVEDCFALPGGESGLGRECYSCLCWLA